MDRRAIFTAGMLAVAAIVGYSIGTERLLPVALVVGVIAVAAMMRVPAWAFPIILVSVSGFISVYAWPRVALAGDGVYVSELLLIAGFAAALPEFVNEVKAGRLKLDWAFWAVTGLFFFSVVGVVVGMTKGAGLRQAIIGFRPMMYLLAYIPAIVAVSTADRLRRIGQVAVILGALTAAAAVLQFFLGESRLIFAIGSFEALVRPDPTTGFFRVRPPGLYLVYAVAAWGASATLWADSRRMHRLGPPLLVVCLASIALSFNRNMIVGLVIGLTVAFLVGRKRGRTALIAVIFAAVVLTGVMVVGDIEVSQPLVARFASLLDPGQRGAALTDRAYESAMAVNTVVRDPIFGVGWGPGYGALATRSVGGLVSSFERPWIHNQYLNQWVRTGLAGAVMLAWLFVGSILRAARTIRRATEPTQWLDMALLASITAFALSAMVDIVIANPNNLVVLMMIVALISVRSNVESVISVGE